MNVTAFQGHIHESPADTLIVNLFEGANVLTGQIKEINQALGGVIDSHISKGAFIGQAGEVRVFYPCGAIPAEQVIVIGTGQRKNLSLARIQQFSQQATQLAQALNARNVATLTYGENEVDLSPKELAQAIVNGAMLAVNSLTRPIESLSIVTADESKVAALKEGMETAVTTFLKDISTDESQSHLSGDIALTAIQQLSSDNKKLHQELHQEQNERRWAEIVLRQRNDELTLLNRAMQTVNSTLDLEEVLEMVLNEARNLLKIASCSIWLLDPNTKELVCHQITSSYGEQLRGWRLAPGEGIAGWVIANNQSLIVSDAQLDERHFSGIDEQTKVVSRSIMTVPLQMNAETIGVIQAVDEMADRFSLTDLVLMKSLAAATASAIKNARLFSNLKGAQEKLLQQERLTALGQMAATVAHEIRNPLMAIRMGIDYLLRDVSTDDPRQRGAALIRTNIERINFIVEDILFLARVSKSSLSPGDIRIILETELANWETRLRERKVACTLQIPPNLPAVGLDTHQMSRAISNLINNSVEALMPGGQLQITVDCIEPERVQLTFADDGPGISPENLSRIFDPFFTTKSRGTGLGLFIVKQIIEDHQGQIEVRSEKGAGTMFRIILPVLDTAVTNP